MTQHTLSALFVALFAVAACGPADDHAYAPDPNPTGEVVGEDDLASTAEALGSRPIMRMPFRCGQEWTATTWAGHSPEQAIDWNRAGDFGDAVVASAAGRVTRSESEGNVSYGNWIEIEHSGGYRTRYAHLSVRGARVGDRVKMGDKIGEVGNSGGSSGSHLHYEQLAGQTPVRVILGGGTHVHYFGSQTYRSANDCP
ncbi:MAG: M23 family metallopeptidase [Archangiaceae bacterium]|nr:M23 family metallopeptidase [Archangiaceae bacterium]